MPRGASGASYLEDHGDRLVLRPSVEDALGWAAALAFVAAPAVLVAASLAAAVMAGGDGGAFVAGWAVGAGLSAPLALVGLLAMATARRRAERGVVKIDLAERLVYRRGGGPDVLRGVREVRVRGGRWPWSGFTLELAHDDGRVTSLVRAARGRGRSLASSAEHLADALGLEADVPPSARSARPLLPREPRVAGALCYAPIDGVFVGASVFYLMTSMDPFVRFSAKQSLLGWALEALAALLLLGCCGVPFALVLPDGLTALGVAPPLLGLAAARVVVRTVAAMRAHRGMVWIQPWLAPLARRWAPPPGP